MDIVNELLISLGGTFVITILWIIICIVTVVLLPKVADFIEHVCDIFGLCYANLKARKEYDEEA